MLTCGNALVLPLSSSSSAVQIPAVYFWFRMFSYTATRFQLTPRLRILGAYKLHRSLALQAQKFVMILTVYSSNFRKNGSSSANTLTTNRFTGSSMEKFRHPLPRLSLLGYQARIMKTLDIPIPPGVSCTGHSLRRGGASAVHVINVSLSRIVHWGLWKDASTALGYIDVTVQPDEGSFVFFSKLLSRTG